MLLSFGGCNGSGAPPPPAKPTDPKVAEAQKQQANEQLAEMKKFVSKWQATICFKNGKRSREGIGRIITFTPEDIIIDGKKCPYSVNPRANPTEINIAENGVHLDVFGIYHFRDDKLTLHLARNMMPRPTSFDPESGVYGDGWGYELTVYKRVKE